MTIVKYNRALSEVPHSKAIAGVRVGLIGEKFVVNPTTMEMEDSELDLLLAGTDDAILMIEVNSNHYVIPLEVCQSSLLSIIHDMDVWSS